MPNIAAARAVYPHADAVGRCTVFDIGDAVKSGTTAIRYRVSRMRRAGMVVNRARRTAFTDSAFWNTRAMSGSSKTAKDPPGTRLANRFGFALA